MILPSFEEYLRLLPAELLFEKFLTGAERSRKILSSSLIHDAARRFSSEKSLQSRFAGLSPETRLFCAIVYLAGDCGVPAPGLAGFSDKLLSSFLVFAGDGTEADASRRYFGFSEFEPALAASCARAIVDACAAPSPGPCPVPFPWQCLVDVAMCMNLAFLGRLEKTKKGGFSRAAEACLDRLLHAGRELSESEGWPAAARETCVSLTLSYAASRGLIVDSEGSCTASRSAAAEWLALSLEARLADFREHASGRGVLWRVSLLEKMFTSPGRPWITSASFPGAARADAERCAAALRYCGYVDVCKKPSGAVMTASARPDLAAPARKLPENRVTLLPDFSAVISREALPEDVYWFGQMGEISSLDRVYKGAIKRDVINDSLSGGVEEKSITDRLAAWKAPHNVVETVREWIREFMRLHVTTGASVVSFDERATRQILSYEPLKNLVTQARPHSIFSIRPGSEAEVKRILGEMGFDTREPGGVAAKARTAPAAAAAGQPRRIAPVASFGHNSEAAGRSPQAGKYGRLLKELDVNDMLHVFDYAVLMGQCVAFEYKGSPRVKAGTYSVRPFLVRREREPLVEAEAGPKKSKKTFVVAKIGKIGVVAE